LLEFIFAFRFSYGIIIARLNNGEFLFVGITCHGECVQENGCWGTLADECVRCRSFRFL